jgi:hypothetical protein
VVAVSVRDQDVTDLLAANCRKKRVTVCRIVRAGVDDRKHPGSDEVGVRAAEGERPAVPRGNSAHSWSDLDGAAVFGREVAIDDQLSLPLACGIS